MSALAIRGGMALIRLRYFKLPTGSSMNRAEDPTFTSKGIFRPSESIWGPKWCHLCLEGSGKLRRPFYKVLFYLTMFPVLWYH